MSKRTLILSDTHLGRPGRATVQALRPLWQGVDELVVNGDIAEVQIPWLRSAAIREVDKLDALTRRDGVGLTIISGNHDAYLTDRRCLQLAEGRVLIMHGDALHPAVAPWTRSAKAMQRLTERELSRVAPEQRACLHTRLAIAQHVGHSEFLEEYVLSSRGESNAIKALCRPWDIPPVLRYWVKEPALARQFMIDYAPSTRYLILGHSHHPGVWQRDERTIINTGAFMFPGKPWCATITDGELCVYRIRKRGGLYEQVPRPIFQIHDEALNNTPLPAKQAAPTRLNADTDVAA